MAEGRTKGGDGGPGDASARDHLANERTFLAWVRTALGLIGLGFVLARMGLFLRQLAEAGARGPLPRLHPGGEFLAVGIIVLILGAALAGASAAIYHRTRRAISERRYVPARHAVTALAAVIVAGGLAIIAMLVFQVVAPVAS